MTVDEERAKPNRQILEQIQEEAKRKGHHPKSRIVPPTLEDWELVCNATRGRIGKIAEAFDVSVHTVYKWRDEEEGFNDALNAPREIVMDKLQDVAELMAMGVPDQDPETGRFVGWKERPSEAIILKLFKIYGMNRGFGDNPQEVNVNIKDGTIPVSKWLDLNTEPRQTGEAEEPIE